jgi:hypothetical protein
MNYIGKKVHYLGFINGYFSVIFAEIIEIKNEQDIIIKNEFGKKFEIKSHWITDVNRIVVPKEEQKQQDFYLKCRCGNSKFYYNDEKLTCRECNSEYEKNEIDLLEKTSTLVNTNNESQKTIH